MTLITLLLFVILQPLLAQILRELPWRSAQSSYTVCIPPINEGEEAAWAVVAAGPLLPNSITAAEGEETVVYDHTGSGVRRMTVVNHHPQAAGLGGSLCAEALKEHRNPAEWTARNSIGMWTFEANNLG